MIRFMLPLLEWVNIPGGRVVIDEIGTVTVKPFRLATFPVTNGQFDAFIKDKGYKEPEWWAGLEHTISAPRASNWRESEAPKIQVCWYEAVAYSRWLSAMLGEPVRLPTEAEWQWAAVGSTGWDYPYGPQFDGTKCNTRESGTGRTNPVTEYMGVKTPTGAVDMAGNVWEWCLNTPDNMHDIALDDPGARALRGGSWENGQAHVRASFRYNRTPLTRSYNIGFRLIIEG